MNKKLLKKTLLEAYNSYKSEYGEVEIGFMDEMRVGLIPIIRKKWTKKGERPIACRQIKYKWIYVYNIVFPRTGKVFTMFFSTVNKLCMKLFFKVFREEYPEGHYLIVWDNAGFHQSNDFKGSDYIRFVSLPSYSPELNPAETLNPIFKSFIANKVYNKIEELIDELIKGVDFIEKHIDNIRNQTSFHWIKNILATS